jgi:hypothetical protein
MGPSSLSRAAPKECKSPATCARTRVALPRFIYTHILYIYIYKEGDVKKKRSGTRGARFQCFAMQLAVCFVCAGDVENDVGL